jgi:hypothetical protein
MKKMTMLKSIAAVALFAMVGLSANAQFLGSGLPTAKILPVDSISSADTVTVGATMPYFVMPDPVIRTSSLYNSSGFKWTISGTGATLNTGSLTTLSIGGTGTYYKDTMVLAKFTSTGIATISTVERSNPKFNATAGCEQGTTRDLGINVIGLPVAPAIADGDTAQGGCGAAAPYSVKYNFGSTTTKFPAYVQVTVKTYTISGAVQGAAVTKWYQINKASDNIILAQSDLDAAAAGTFVNGRVEVSLGQLYDRISLIDSKYQVNGSAITPTDLVVDASGVHKAAIMVLPTPSTGTIKHLKTL